MGDTSPQSSIEDSVVSTPQSKQPSELSERVIEAAVVVTVAAALGFAMLFRLRAGLGDAPLAVLSIFLNLLLPIWLTAWMICAFTASDTRQRAFLSAVTTLSLLFPILGLVEGRYVTVIAAISVLLIVLLSPARIGLLRWRSLARILAEGSALALLIIVSGAPVRLLLPESMSLGLLQADDLFHMSIAQMIALHWIPSLGADGLIYEHYHFASHATAAGLSRASGASIALVYTYWGALSLKLQLLWAMFLCALTLSFDASKNANIRMFPRILYAMLFLILSSSLESESFLFGLTFFMGLFPLLCSLVEERTKPRYFRVGLVLALVTSVVCATAKVSVGFYCAVALSWVAWRHRRDYATLGVTTLGLCALAAVTVLFLNPTDLTVTSLGLSIIVLSYVEYLNWTTLLSYVLPILVVLVAVTQPQFSRNWVAERAKWRLSVALEALGPKLRTWSATWRSLLALDAPVQLLALCFVACILVLIAVPIGGNMVYFSVVLLLLGSAVLPAAAWRSSGIEVSQSRCSAWLVGAVLVAGLACAQQFATAGVRTVSALYRTAWAGNAEAKRQGGTAGREITSSLRSTGTPFGLLRLQIDTLPWSALVRDLKERDAVGGGLAVHVLPSADDFWRRLVAGTPYWCLTAQLMIPAETGIVEIRGIAPLTIEHECAPQGVGWYGFGKKQDLHRTADLSVEELCDAANRMHVKRVYVLASIAQLSENRVVDCESR